jgi:hypothetical protein
VQQVLRSLRSSGGHKQAQAGKIHGAVKG